MKLAAAPISWGVCEVPDWGLQLAPDRVLSDMRALGLDATEAGPPGFLPSDPERARALLDTRGLRLIGGFVNAALHDRRRQAEELAAVTRQADWLARGGAEMLVLAAGTGRPGYAAGGDISDDQWRVLFEGIDRVADIADQRGLTTVVHPHFGTVIERRHHVMHFLYECGHYLCLDTGHIALGGADPVDVARVAGSRVRHVHLKDLDGDLAERVRAGTVSYDDAVRRGLYRPLGEGVARIAEVTEHLRASGYEGWYVLEQDVMLDHAPESPPPWVARSLGYLRGNG
ncbi:MAG TPA: TIM barrel protein [Candidatus Limnocylindria bacterium]|jgi:inosose dehydratase|nr:TIM barrel protein [Candidatus Limnocylindria bacterium]